MTKLYKQYAQNQSLLVIPGTLCKTEDSRASFIFTIFLRFFTYLKKQLKVFLFVVFFLFFLLCIKYNFIV